jgi:hypothetical protein
MAGESTYPSSGRLPPASALCILRPIGVRDEVLVTYLMQQNLTFGRVCLWVMEGTVGGCAVPRGATEPWAQPCRIATEVTESLQRLFEGLAVVAFCYRLETVELLLRTHPELIQPYSRGHCNLFRHTPLHLASRNGHK